MELTTDTIPQHQDLSDQLFWFIKNKDRGSTEQTIRDEEFSFGSAHIETLGSGAAGKRNEDAPIVLSMGKGRTLFAVLDGASSQKEIDCLNCEGISGAFYISHMVSMGFEATPEHLKLCQKPELTAKDVMVAMNEWIHKKMRDIPGVDYADIPSLPGMAAALVLVDDSNKRLTIAQVADATIALVDNEGNAKVLTPNLNEKFDQETMEYVKELTKTFNSDLSHVRKIPEAKELVRRQLIDSFSRKTNKKGGCGIMNGMPEMVSNNLVYSDMIPMNDKVSSILLFSDGAVQPFTGKNISIEEATQSLADALHKEKNTSILELGASILENDPDFAKIPRMKLKDDATIIEVSFNGK